MELKNRSFQCGKYQLAYLLHEVLRVMNDIMLFTFFTAFLLTQYTRFHLTVAVAAQ